MMRSNSFDDNDKNSTDLNQGDNSEDGSSLGESNDHSERDNVDDDDVFGSLLSWEDEDLPSLSASENMNKDNLDPNTFNPSRAEPMATDGEDEGSAKSNRMESHRQQARNQVLDMMFGFAPPPQSANEVQPILGQQQQCANQNMAAEKAGMMNIECAALSSKVFSNNSNSLDLIFPSILQQHQYQPTQAFYSLPQQGTVQSQEKQKHLTSSPMMNASPASMPQSLQQQSFIQGFHLPSSAVNVHATDQQQQGSPVLGPGNPSLTSLPMQVMRQFSNQVPRVSLPGQQDLQLQQTESESQERYSLLPIPQLIQQNPVLTVMLPGQNPVAVSQQDMWKIFQQKMPGIPQWLIPSMQPCPQPNSLVPSNVVLTANDGAQSAGLVSFDGSYAQPIKQEPMQREQAPAVSSAPQLGKKRDNKLRSESEPSLRSSSRTKKTDSSNSALPGRSGKGKGRYLVKTLLPLISDLTSDSRPSMANLSSKEGAQTQNPKINLPDADGLLGTSVKDEVMQPTLSQETLPRPCKMAKHGGKSILQQSKVSATGATSSSRRKSTSLAQEATLAMNVAKEEEQKEKRMSLQKEQFKQSSVNMMKSSFPIVSNDEMSDTSFRKQVLSKGDPVANNASPLRPSLNLMCPPPPANPSALNSSMSYLNATWNMTKPTINTLESDGATLPYKPQQAEKRLSKSQKQAAMSSQADRVDVEKKSRADSSLHDVVSSSETDGGLTTDAEKEFTNVPLAESELSEGDRNRLNRDRNREHARNTRLRKKAYVEKLRATVDDLCRERDSLVQDRATSASRLVEQQKIRVDVLLAYFALRRQCERRRDLWAGVCEESVICTLPITPYRSFPAYEVQASKLQRTIQGIDGLIADAVSFHVLLDSLIDYSAVFNPRSPYYAVHAVHTASQAQEGSPEEASSPPLLISSASPKIQVQYTLITEDSCPGGSQIMARWTMVTLNAVALGAPCELTNNCMVCAKFSSANKIVSLDHVFDGLAFMLQLKPKSFYNGPRLSSTFSPQNVGLPSELLASADGFKIVPNTVQVSQRHYDVPMILTLADRPYTIMQVNSLWEEMTGYKAEDVVGKTDARILQPRWQQIPNLPAPYQDPALSFLMMEVRLKRAATATLINVNTQGDLFRNVLQVFPLSTDGKITHYLGLTIFKQPLGINWNIFTQNPKVFQQVLQPDVVMSNVASTQSSSAIDSVPSSVQGGLRESSKERDASRKNYVECDLAKNGHGDSVKKCI